jgi:hypothetical protein
MFVLAVASLIFLFFYVLLVDVYVVKVFVHDMFID